MKHRGKNLIPLLGGILIGALLVGPAAQAASEYFQAQRTSHPIYVDGQQVQMETYAINGHNYVQLRDIGEKVGFEVYWDGTAAQIVSDQPYTGLPPVQESPAPAAAEDHSQSANPSIFTGDLTREVYNGLRDAIIHQEEILTGAYPRPSMGDNARNPAVSQATRNFSRYPVYEAISQSGGGYVCDVRQTEAYTPAAAYTQSFIDGLTGKSDREKVTEIVWYVADRLTYSVTYPSLSDVLTQDGEVPGACMAYAHSFMFLCNRVGIPCIFKVGDNHQWNMVYVEGRWWDVDVTANDTGDDTSDRGSSTILWDPQETGMVGPMDEYPQITAFTQELLVPGSTR